RRQPLLFDREPRDGGGPRGVDGPLGLSALTHGEAAPRQGKAGGIRCPALRASPGERSARPHRAPSRERAQTRPAGLEESEGDGATPGVPSVAGSPEGPRPRRLTASRAGPVQRGTESLVMQSESAVPP